MPRTEQDWQGECRYICRVARHEGRVLEMNYDTGTFIRYCEMQRDLARREGRDDSAEFIGRVIDDLRSEPL